MKIDNELNNTIATGGSRPSASRLRSRASVLNSQFSVLSSQLFDLERHCVHGRIGSDREQQVVGPGLESLRLQVEHVRHRRADDAEVVARVRVAGVLQRTVGRARHQLDARRVHDDRGR